MRLLAALAMSALYLVIDGSAQYRRDAQVLGFTGVLAIVVTTWWASRMTRNIRRSNRTMFGLSTTTVVAYGVANWALPYVVVSSGGDFDTIWLGHIVMTVGWFLLCRALWRASSPGECPEVAWRTAAPPVTLAWSSGLIIFNLASQWSLYHRSVMFEALYLLQIFYLSVGLQAAAMITAATFIWQLAKRHMLFTGEAS